MASFVIHDIVGERFLSAIEKKYNIKLTEQDKKSFLLGNLIPDLITEDKELPLNLSEEEQKEFYRQRKIKVRKEKITTHFRTPDSLDLCIKIPECNLFINKYSELLTHDFSALGYLFHLFTDKLFFGELFDASFVFLDKEGKQTKYKKDVTSVKILKIRKTVPYDDFWNLKSPLNIYTDYTKMNKLLVETYGINIDKEELLEFSTQYFKNPGIEEVDYDRIGEIVTKLFIFIEGSYSIKDNELQAFDKATIRKFIEFLPKIFIKTYEVIINMYFKDYPREKERGEKMIFASNNKGKLTEIKSIFYDQEILSLKDAGIDIDVVEDADSFYGNALKKAKEIYQLTKQPVIADDSGLCLEALDGWPGVLTHRFAGENIPDEDRNNRIIESLKTTDNKKASVVCTLVYFDGEIIITGEGVLHGTISNIQKGTNGFGFDPIFVLENDKTLAELTSEEKNKCSARYLAAVDLRRKLIKQNKLLKK